MKTSFHNVCVLKGFYKNIEHTYKFTKITPLKKNDTTANLMERNNIYSPDNILPAIFILQSAVKI